MAVGAAAVEILDGTEWLWLRGVAATVVAAVAYAWHARLQQLGIARSVRLVTVRAVLHNRRVLPEERSTSFGVAA